MTYEQSVAAGVGWDTAEVVREWTGLAPLDGDASADLCVIGLGGSGLAVVEDALSRGMSVVGLDAGRVAAAAAGRNGGILAPGGAMPWAVTTPGVSFDDKVALHRRTVEEMQHLERLLGRSVVEPASVVRISGFVRGPRDDAERRLESAQHEEALAEAAAMRAAGIVVEEYDDEWGRGLVFPEGSRINPAVRAIRLAEHVVERGAALHECTRVTHFRPGSVVTDHGIVRATRVVVAVDGRLPRLLPQLSSAVTTVRLQMLATAPLSRRVLEGALSARDDFEWMQQDAAGRLLIGGGRDQHLAAETTESGLPTRQVQAWIEEQAERAAGEPVTVTHRWAAPVGYTDDRRALCVPVEDGLVGCGGYSGTGNLVGPVAAKAALAYMVDQTPVPAYFRSTVGRLDGS